MRLSNKEVDLIKTTVEGFFENPRIYLFGSRVDDTKKGGDIDLFVISDDTEALLEKKLKVASKLERILHKPIDIVVHRNCSKRIEQEAMQKGILL